MTEERDESSGRGWARGVLTIVVLVALYVLILGPLELLFVHFGWKDSLIGRIFPVIYYPLVYLADVTGTLDWLGAYMEWWSNLADP